jgi:hypothetical protein
MKSTIPLHRVLWLILLASLSAILFAACSSVTEPEPTPTPTRTPRPPTPLPPTSTPTPAPTPTPAWPVTVFVPQGLPAAAADALKAAFADHPDLFVQTSSVEIADIQIVRNVDPKAIRIAELVYAVVAPFPTLTDEVAWTDIASSWSVTPTGSFADRPLLVTAETAEVLAAAMGQPGSSGVEIVPAEEIVQRAWGSSAWAILPFDQLEPRWKVLRVDGVSVLDKSLNTDTYPLVVRVGVAGIERGVVKLQELLGSTLTNRDPSKMTVLMMTGVTALTRATAMRMERHGVLYPAGDIHDWLVEPDITHISNEVSFAENCPPPGDYYTLVFCSNPRYIELLESVDIDVIELTGNHLLDWKVKPMELSLTMYDERGIPYFGGGWNLEQAQSPLTLTHGVHTFGFVGCNPVGPGYDWATEDRPGSAPCDYDRLYAQIRELRDRGVIPVATFQYWEFSQYEPTSRQRADFRALAEAGAVIVSGSQAHQPQGFDFHAGAFIHYGLGNLFFDQMQSLETRQEFLDRHVFYDGRHISTEILTAILEDYSRPRPMMPDEREALLKAAFAASGW